MKKLFLFLFVINLSTYQPINSLYAVENLNTNETKLATIPNDYQEVSNIVFSANGKQVAYKVRKDGKPTPFVEGRGEEFVVVGNRAGKSYDRVAKEGFLILSPDGQRIAYEGKRGAKEYLVVDGKESIKSYDDVTTNTFSPDSRLLVSQVEEEKKWFVIVTDGDRETFHSPHYDYSNIPPLFSPDSRFVLFQLDDFKERKSTIFLGDAISDKIKIARTYDQIRSVVISPVGPRFVYKAVREGKNFLVLNDYASDEEKEMEVIYDDISNFIFSPDGEWLSYNAIEQGKTIKVVTSWDNPSRVKESRLYDLIEEAVFSSDGSLVAYSVNKNGRWFVVSGASDGSVLHQEGKSYDWVESPVFSPDGTKIAYPASKDGKWCVVIGEWEGHAYDMVVSPIFSLDGSKVIYRVRRGEGQRFIVIGDSVTGAVVKEGPVCDEVWQPVISVDGKYVCYGARIGRELWWKSADLR